MKRNSSGRPGMKLIIGMVGMGSETVEGCATHKAVYAVFPGKCAVLAASAQNGCERMGRMVRSGNVLSYMGLQG